MLHFSAPQARSKWDIQAARAAALNRLVTQLQPMLAQLQTPEAQRNIRERFLQREPTDEAGRLSVENRDLSVNVASDWWRRPDDEAGAIAFCPHRMGAYGVGDPPTTGTKGKEGLADQLQRNLLRKVVRFRGGDSLDDQNDFIEGRNNIMVATKAFGMGIDKAGVRFTVSVVHSGSLEAFVQEAGRAGRDRRMALAVILYCPQLISENTGKGQVQKMTSDEAVHRYFYGNNFIVVSR